ncbi:heterokaryon incompatibility protein-domain-containing protein, partial [Suillus spraguei]
LLSHRWEETEAVLPDIQDKVMYKLDELGGITKLQSFCKVACDAGYRWAWMDTCCINRRSNTEVQESVNSMFVWYRRSALIIIYLSDVPPSSKPSALARSIWNERGWTLQELVAPKVIIFYQKDW